MNKLKATFVSDVERDERYVEIYSSTSETSSFLLCEILFENVNAEEPVIQFDKEAKYDFNDFMIFLQKTTHRLVNERAPKGQRRIEDIVWDEDKQWPEENK